LIGLLEIKNDKLFAPETLVYLLSGVGVFGLLLVFSVLGGIKKLLFDQVQKATKSHYLFSFVKMLLYLLLIPIYISSFQDSDSEILSLLNLKHNGVIEIFSIVISSLVFIYMEKFDQIINKSGLLLIKIKNRKTLN